ncbi:tyrosine-type recombinase/integrase [Methyloglobulus morosus]|uniref:tyrosine-type recombinase/integrase n=1 Tax=Methyloglobulus morosus TaxID=1410681 RepID=UPI003899508C
MKISVNGRRIQKSTGTEDRQAAQEYHDRLKTELWEQVRLGVKPGYLWQDAVLRWLKETEHKASRDHDIKHLRFLDKHLNGVYLHDINRDMVDSLIQSKLATKVCNTTVNRMLQLVRAILRRASIEWEWLDKVPKIRLLKEPDHRIRWITREEADRLVLELPEHLKAIVEFSLQTGLRRSNATGLQWSQVDLVRRIAWIHADQAKSRKAIPVPLSKTAVIIIREQIGKHHSYVFSYKGKPIIQVNTKAWRLALKRAGIENFRWHDLRHTWASWHVQNGTPLHALQSLGGWHSAEMVQRYAHLSGEHLAGYVDKLFELRSVDVEQNSYDSATLNN